MKKEIIEEWKPIEGFEGKYQVSNLGRIKSLRNNKNNPREMIMKQNLRKDGYYQICLWKNGKRKQYFVHRLVAIAFIPNPNNLPMINHKDENPSNNCVDNLEWCDQKYNVNYGTAIERKVKNTDYKKIAEKIDYQKRNEKIDFKKITEKLKNRKDLSKPILQLDLEGNIIAEYPSINEAERQTGFKHSNICKCLKCKRKTCGGFIWRYKE